jgi:hypothetical protein
MEASGQREPSNTPIYNVGRLNKMIAEGKIDTSRTEWVDAYNQCTNSEVCGTILTRVDASGNYFISERVNDKNKAESEY